MRGSGNGAISLVSEYIANRVAHQLGWPVPDAAWIYIEEGFPWVFGTDEFDDILQKSYGWNLGIENLEDIVSSDFDKDCIDDPQLLNIAYTIDLFFQNVDRTQQSGNFIRDKQGRTWIIDHGSLLLFQDVSRFGNELFVNHCFHERYKELRFVYDKRLHHKELFARVINEIPDAILAETRFTKDSLLILVENRIQQLEET